MQAKHHGLMGCLQTSSRELGKLWQPNLILNELIQIQQFWTDSSEQQDLIYTNIIHLYKSKKDRATCDNYVCTLPLNIASIITACIIYHITSNFLVSLLKEYLQKQRCESEDDIDLKHATKEMIRCLDKVPCITAFDRRLRWMLQSGIMPVVNLSGE